MERKSFEFKGSISENFIEGAASVMGVIDRGGDVIFPGAFKKVLKGFAANGFVPVGHNWSGLPVAMPVETREQGTTLWSKAEFHSTPDAQNARTVCMERIEKNLSVGLSVGFSIAKDGASWFEKGSDLLAFAQGKGFDLSQFDSKAIKSYDRMCRAITEVGELYEYSIVAVPMNRQALAALAKTFSSEDMTFSDESESVLNAVRGLISRMAAYSDMREEQERPLSAERLHEAKQMIDQLNLLVEKSELRNTKTNFAEMRYRELSAKSAALAARS